MSLHTSSSYNVCMVSIDNKDNAEQLAHKILTERLAACVNIIPRVTSMYWWEGKIQKDEEYLLIIKTLSEYQHSLTQFVKSNHPYKCCEVIFLPIEAGNAAYLTWISENCLVGK